jgi:uncharacterized protein YbcI
VSVTRRRLHCLRPLSDAPHRPATHLEASRSLHAELKGGTADAVSRALVGLLRTRTGRGPTKVKTALSTDLALVTLEDFLTRAEQRLISEGRRALASQFRTALLEGMRADAVEAVEQITGRQVAAYLTAHQQDPDLAVIAFHLAPSDGLDEDR